MTDATAEQAEVPEKSGKKGMIVGVILAVAGAAGGYFLTTSGLLPFGGKPAMEDVKETDKGKAVKALPQVGFIDLPPVIVSVNAGDSGHL